MSSPDLTVRQYIAKLQALVDAGHGDLPLCFLSEDGYHTCAESAGPTIENGEYEDGGSTRWSYKRGPFIAA